MGSLFLTSYSHSSARLRWPRKRLYLRRYLHGSLEPCIANNLNPYFYLSYLFTEAPKMAANGVDWVTAMLPHNAPASCQGEKKDRGQN